MTNRQSQQRQANTKMIQKNNTKKHKEQNEADIQEEERTFR